MVHHPFLQMSRDRISVVRNFEKIYPKYPSNYVIEGLRATITISLPQCIIPFYECNVPTITMALICLFDYPSILFTTIRQTVSAVVS